jgi:hypothetical protein
MTANQLEWMQSRGLDPAQYDMTPDGRVIRKQVPIAAAPQREVMSPLRAAGTSFLGSVLPSAAGLGGAVAAPAAAASIYGAPLGPLGMIAAGTVGALGAGYLGGKAQEAALERFAPSALEELSRAQTDQPVASYLGGFAPNAMAFRPSLQGMSGLLRPTVRGTATLGEALAKPEFLAPAMNVGANVAGATAGQLVDMSQGGEFSAPRFASDVALGTLFNKPTALGRRIGFQDIPQSRELPAPDVAAARSEAEFMAYPPREFSEPRSERGFEDVKAPGVNIAPEAPEQYFTSEGLAGKGVRKTETAIDKDYTKWWKSETEPTTDLLKGAAEEVKAQIPRDRLKELSNDPEVGEVLRDPSKMPAFIAKQADESLEIAFQNYRRPAVEASREVYAGDIEGAAGRPPSLSQVAKADKSAYEAYSGYKAPEVPEAPKSAQVVSQELYGPELAGPSGRPPSLAQVNKADKTAYEAYSGYKAPEVKQNATDAAREVYTRLQRPEGAGENRITQEDINFANEVANRRGLRIELDRAFAGDQEVRGMYFVDPNTGERIIRVNPLMATPDTAIHEIGHDVFRGVTNEGMRRSLLDTALDSPAYKSELAARLKEGMPEAKARDIALEEGLIQAFGEKMPGINRGELRSWFKAFKASLKQLATGKLSPEDALAWMHYATTEAVPWKGAVAVKGGEERFSRAKEASRRMTADDIDWDNIGALNQTRELNLEDLISGVIPELKMYQEKGNVFREDVVISREPRLLSSEGSWGRAWTTGARNEGHVMIDSALWDAAVANEPGMRERFVKVLKHELGHIDDAPNIGEYGSARDERVADEFAARYQRAQQEISSSETSLAQIPAVFKSKTFVPRGTNLDIGAGKFDLGKQYLESQRGVSESVPFDPFNRSIESNQMAVERLQSGERFGTATIPNVLNVIAEASARDNVILQAARAIEPEGVAYFQIYEGDRSGIGRKTSKGFQNNKKTSDYANEVSEHFDNVSKTGNIIVATNPKISSRKAFWQLSPDESGPSVRYQRGSIGKAADVVKGRIDKTLGEIDQITRRGGIYETVGRAMNRAYNTADSMLGKARSLGTSISKLSYADAAKLTSHLYNEYRNQQLITPAPEIAQAYNEWRTQAKPFWVNEANKAGHQIRSGKGLRDRIESEFWLPGQKESDEVREILASKVGTPEYQKLKDDYLRDATDDYLSKGMQQDKAQEKALVDFEERRALINRNFDPSAPATFAGARKPMGRPLPESWVEKDFRKVFENYNRRSAKDYAAQEHFEKSPEVMAALGSKKFFNDQDIPASVLQNTDVIAPDPSVQSVMREFSGTPAQIPGKAVRSFGSMASALALQTISRIGDVGGTVTKPLAYIGLGDYGAYMGGMAEKLSNWSKLQARSIESGLNNPNAHQNFRQVVGVGEDAGKYMQKVLDGLGFITGSSKLESIARTLAQAQGEMIVSINKRKALTGDKDAVRFLDTLNSDWRTQSDMDLAAQFGRMMQGSYDMRQLPAWFLEGGAAPYLTWSKWSMGQMNNFRKFAVEPAMQGNLKPLIAQVLVGMAGGGAIEQIQEWLNNKESKAVKWSELQSWAEQNEGTIGTDGGELLLQKLMMMAQKTGTFGFAGDLAMMPINALVGDTQSAVGVFPAAELATDIAKNLAGAITAIDKGEDVGLVLQRFGKNVIVGKTQMLRVANNWVDEIANEGTENLRSADRRKMRLFEELSGTGRSNGMFPVSYENLAEQEFERGEITPKTGEEAMSLVTRAREQATTPEDYASRIRKLKTSQNAIMPSLERQPMKAARYLSWVEGAEEGRGAETMRRYMIREQENKYRKSLVEGLSGLR